MVTQLKVVSLAFLLVALATQSVADVVTRVDRTNIEQNESFKLDVITDSILEPQDRPDLSALEQDFFVGQGSERTNTTIVGGQMHRIKTWSYALMAKRTGDITIPPISVGPEQSEPLVIRVSEPTYAPPGEAEVFITSEVDFDETYVQAQVLLTVKVFRSVPTRQHVLRDPVVSGVEVLRELAGDDRQYDAVIDDTVYTVDERVYAIFPQESGSIDISPARFDARVLRNGRITGVKVFESQALTVSVQPIPERPADFPDATWLPARDLQISEDWSRDTDEITAGEPLTRHVTISALGLLETQIPALDAPDVDGINVYPDKPELGQRIEAGGIRGVRKDQYAMIGIAAGTVTLPAVEVPWWNVMTSEWQVASLPERTLAVAPAEDAVLPAPQPETTTTAEAAETTEVSLLGEKFWRRATQFFALLWAATLLAWWRTSRPQKREPREPPPVPIHKRQSRLLKEARKAARVGDGPGVKQKLLEWAALEWPDDAPRSIGMLAKRVSPDLAGELEKLSNLSYGPSPGEFDGDALIRAIRSFSVIKSENGASKELLPPLMPSQ